MILTLEVTGPEAAKLAGASRKVFDACGGTIGRLADNAWVLPDPYVSSRHAVIRHDNGTFYIEDTSTNGIFINSPDHRVVPGQPYALKSGDWIFIDPYEIRAVIVPALERDTAAPADDPFAAVGPPPRVAATTPPPSPMGPSLVGGDEVVDPLSLLGFEAKRAPVAAPTAADLARNSVLTDHYHAPPPRPRPARDGVDASAPAGLIPDDYDPLGSDDRAHASPRTSAGARPLAGPSRPPVPQPAAAPPVSAAAAARPGDGVLDAVLAGAGLSGVAVTPELARDFGEILRVVVAGVMDVLQARQRIKSEFRMQMTNFRPAANNPLKFSANVDDALHNLLVKRNPAYLGAIDAFEDAFADLRNHQVATLAGVRVAFEAMLAEFAPDRLQEEFDRQVKKGALLAVPARLRYWESYRDRYAALLKDTETSFRQLFGDEFTKAYEEQLERLKSRGSAASREVRRQS